MTLAKPTNSMTPDQFGATWPEDRLGDNYQLFHGRTFPQPAHHKTDKKKEGYEPTIELFVIDDANARDFECRFKINSGEVVKNFSAVAATTKDGWMSSNDDNTMYLNGRDESAHSDNLAKIKNNSSELRFSGSDVATPASDELVCAIHQFYPNSTESTIPSLEIIPCESSTPNAFSWVPYGENESCAAYSMKKGIAENTNIVSRETRGSWVTMIWSAPA